MAGTKRELARKSAQSAINTLVFLGQLGKLIRDLLDGQVTELTLSASVKQWTQNTGSILSITNRHNHSGREQRCVKKCHKFK